MFSGMKIQTWELFVQKWYKSRETYGRRQGKINLKALLEIIESVVFSPFVKAEADLVEYFVLCLKRYVRLSDK
jgi:hypothetical protein